MTSPDWMPMESAPKDGMAEPVIFLDVDGVLNNRDTWNDKSQRGCWRLCPASVERFNRVVAATGSRVVVSSSWRGVGAGERKLRRAGVLSRWHKDKRTPRLEAISPGGFYLAKTRGDEIQDWLSRHPEVDRYVIVDDDSDMLSHQMPRFVKTDFMNGGLLDEHCDLIAALLVPAHSSSSETPPPDGGSQ